METTKKRIDAIDAARGLAVILMVIHHLFLDLIIFFNAPAWLFTNWVFTPLHYVFAGLFIFLSGVSSRFSRNNLLRGARCLGIALAMTFVTSLPPVDDPIKFGVLHLLGVCMLIYGAFEGFFKRIKPAVLLSVSLAGIVLSVFLLYSLDEVMLIDFCKVLTPEQEAFWGQSAKYLYLFGWITRDFYSADYFPLLPWFFVFTLGTWAGYYIRERSLPEGFYTFTCPVLPQIGRASLLVYVLHQPILYGIFSLIKG